MKTNPVKRCINFVKSFFGGGKKLLAEAEASKPLYTVAIKNENPVVPSPPKRKPRIIFRSRYTSHEKSRGRLRFSKRTANDRKAAQLNPAWLSHPILAIRTIPNP